MPYPYVQWCITTAICDYCKSNVARAAPQWKSKEQTKNIHIWYNTAIQPRVANRDLRLIWKDFSESLYIEEHPYLITVSGVKHLAFCESYTCFITVFARNVSYSLLATGGWKTEWFCNGFWHIHYSIWNTLKVYFTVLRLALRAAISYVAKLIQQCCAGWTVPANLSCKR